MHEQTPRNLPWLDRLTMHIPGYGGYQERANRRAADRALRDAIAQRLGTARTHIEAAIRACIDRQALTQINALERAGRHLDRIADRLRSAGSGTDHFYQADHIDPAKTDTLHSLDLALFERADVLAQRFELPDDDHDRLANFEAGLNDFEQKLDQRAMLLQGIR
jgi:hypothetical protein